MWGTLDDREREARRAVLTHIAEGRVPDAGSLAVALACTSAEAARLLDVLVEKGYVVRDVGQEIVAAYPFSVRPTRNRVLLGNGRWIHALCAVDALGVSPLFGMPARIEARCPHCEGAILLEIVDGEVRNRDPASAVLWYSMADLLEKRIEGLDLAAEH